MSLPLRPARVPQPSFRRYGVPSLVAAAAVLLAIGASSPAYAFPVQGGCHASATAFTHAGKRIDQVTGPGPAASSARSPFLVDLAGSVAYRGQTPGPIRDYTWSLSVDGIHVLTSHGGNDGGQTAQSGRIDVAQVHVPVRVVGTFEASSSFAGAGGACSGSGWVRLIGNPTGTPLWDLGLALSIIGLLVGIAAKPRTVQRAEGSRRRSHPFLGALAGLLLGLGIASLAVVYGIYVLGVRTPVIVPPIGLLVGLAWGLAGPAGGRPTSAAA